MPTTHLNAMSALRAARCLATSVALLALSAESANAAFAYAQAVECPNVTVDNPGAAFADSAGKGIGSASAIEFKRGVAVSGIADGYGDFVENRITSGAATEARAASRTVGSNLEPNSAAFARYEYQWSVGGPSGGFSGLGDATVALFADGEERRTSRGNPLDSALLIVNIGDLITLNWSARAGATCSGTRPCSALADFGHTLRWGGVTGVYFRDSLGQITLLPP